MGVWVKADNIFLPKSLREEVKKGGILSIVSRTDLPYMAIPVYRIDFLNSASILAT